ncbi:MAG: hypothetical protein ACO1RX_20000 [Candidatus Sericytochromatia bacterium]
MTNTQHALPPKPPVLGQRPDGVYWRDAKLAPNDVGPFPTHGAAESDWLLSHLIADFCAELDREPPYLGNPDVFPLPVLPALPLKALQDPTFDAICARMVAEDSALIGASEKVRRRIMGAPQQAMRDSWLRALGVSPQCYDEIKSIFGEETN